ncbi:MAG TPA: TatD family hydrolase [Syntrophales bacterium]|nr:TatD family hydrolase [Syntrophales bacterium]
MTMINSVLGPISPDELGKTLVHEHFVCAQVGWYATETTDPYDREEALRVNLDVCRVAKEVGIKTIMDCTTNDLPRDPLLYKALAKQSGLNIICVTGLFSEHLGASHYWVVKTWFNVDIARRMADLFIQEITKGIGKTGVKAGAIKVASGETISDYDKKVFTAAVMAQKETGVPIITHTEGPNPGLEQADWLIKEGADLSKAMIGHVSNSTDFDYQKAIADKGFYIGFDRLGFSFYTQDDVCIKNIATLCRQGYTDKIMLSQDSVNFWAGRPVPADIPKDLADAMSKTWRVDHVCRDIIPALKEAGVTDKQIETMLVDNPRRLFTGK